MFNKKKKQWFKQKPNYKRGNETDKPQTVEGQNQAQEMEDVENNIPETVEAVQVVPVPESPAEVKPENAPATGETGTAAIVNPAMCPVCNMPVRSHYTALHHKTTGEPVHFDCVLRELSKENYPKLGRYRKIYYIGAGNFAIVKEFYDKRGHFKNYEIVEKISYEKKEK